MAGGDNEKHKKGQHELGLTIQRWEDSRQEAQKGGQVKGGRRKGGTQVVLITIKEAEKKRGVEGL